VLTLPTVVPGKKPVFIAVKRGREFQAVRLDAAGQATLTLGVGQSMAPLLLPGDRAELKKLPGPPALGAVVTFERAGRLITHRVIKVRGESFWARGDNSPAIEGPLPLGCIKGEVIAFWRGGKRHEISSPAQRLLGLTRNRLMAELRELAARYPGLRRLVEINLLSSRPVRRVYGFLLEKLLGAVEIVEEKDPMQKLSLVLRAGELPDEKTVRWLEEKINRNKLFAYKAYFPRKDYFAGSVVLLVDGNRAFGRAGYVGWLQVSFGFRGSGVGRELLRNLERTAGKLKVKLLVAQVRSDNLRSLGLFEKLGYRRLAAGDLKKLPAGICHLLNPDTVVVVKGPL
jgi:ribosomal protein S18 acetylase RimI-like enzyme